MEKFKPVIISKEFINAASDALITNNNISFTAGSASAVVLTDDQANTNNYNNAQLLSKDAPAIVTGYKNTETNTIVANVKISNKTLSSDVRISTILVYATYNGVNILVATARLNSPELLPAFDPDKGVPSTLEYALNMQVSNLINAPVQFNEAGLATNKDLQALDGAAVHKRGDERIYDVKTFDKPIIGTADITVHYLWDGVDIDTIKTPGLYSGYNVKTAQSSNKENFSLFVEVSDGRYSVKQTKSSYDTGITSVRFYNNNSWSAFTNVPSDDKLVLHSVGDEDAYGKKNFKNSVTSETSIATTKDNTMINGGGNDQSLALVKQTGSAPFLAIGSQNLVKAFKIKQSNQQKISPTDTFTDIFSVDNLGKVYAGINQDLIPLDKNVLHNTGDEKIYGNKEFDKTIKGNITGSAGVADYKNNLIPDNYDVSTISVSGYYYARNANGVSGLPKEFNAKYFDLSAWLNGSNGFMFIVDDSNNMYFRKRQNGYWQDYTAMPLDASKLPRNDKKEVVHEEWTFEKDINGTSKYSRQPVLFDIADGTDLNSIRTSGSYSCGTNRTGNAPINNWFSLVVVQNGDFNGTQTLTDTNSGEVYTRVWNTSGNWFSPWEKLSSDSKVMHLSGDESINGSKNFKQVVIFENGIVNKPISMNGFRIDVSNLVSGTYNVWQGDISGCPADYGIVEVFENVSNKMYRFTQTNLPEPHVWIQLKNSGGFTGWKQQM